MIYLYITLVDGTEIVHTYVFGVYGLKKVEVHFERPKENGFDTARCQLPSYKLIIRDGFTDEEMKRYQEVIESTAHLIIEFSQQGGFDHAASF